MFCIKDVLFVKEIRNIVKNLYELLEDNKESNKSTEFNSLVLNVLDKLCDKVEALQVNQETLEESISFLNEDISEIQEDLFEEVSIEDLEAYEDEYVEVTCNHCKKTIFIETQAINNNEMIPCPYCSSNIVI